MCDQCGPASSATELSRRKVLSVGAAAGLVSLLPVRLRRATRPLPQTVEPLEVVPGLAILPRSAWATDSRPPLGTIADEPDVRFLLVHHSASPNDYGPSDVAGILQGFHAFHTGAEKGWPDIAYNFLIDRFGVVWEGRAGSIGPGPAKRGDATGGNQGFSQLVCLIGDFTSVPPSKEAQANLVKVLAWLADRHGLDTSPGAQAEFVSLGSNRHPAGTTVVTPTINGHRSMSLTSCPGDAFFPIVESALPERVTQQRTATPPSTTARPSTTAPPTSTAPSSTTRASTATSTATPARPAAAEADADGPDLGVLGSAAAAAAVAAAGLVAFARGRGDRGR